MRTTCGLVLALTLLSVTAAAAQDDGARRQRPVFTTREAASPITVDARLDEPAWAEAEVIPVLYEWFPGDNTAAPVETEVRVTFDRDAFYIGFIARDPQPQQIRAHLADRDTPFQEDTVGFLLDTFNDRRRAYQFRINPLGVQMDAINSDVDGVEDWSFDLIWDSAGRITDEGYVVEVAIPFKQLRFPAGDGVQTWGFVATRDLPRSVRHRLYSAFNDRDLSCFVCQFQTLTGLEGVAPGRDLELDPTVTARRTDRRAGFPSGSLEDGDEDVEAGLSVRWGLRPNLTLNAALNPDFSQVEADSAQLAVNERFALFFPEKRPFFLEGSDLFATPINAVFTRTIADPEYGAKLTGKEGPHTYGVFVAEDRINNLIFPANQGSSSTSLDADVFSGVARYRRDLGSTSTLGVLYTGRSGDDYTNQVLAVDGNIRLTSSDVIGFQVLRSETEYPLEIAEAFGQPRGRFGDEAFQLGYRHGERDWFWFAEYQDLGPGFRADSGFRPRVDQRRGQAGIERTFRGEEGSWYRQLQVFLGADSARDHSGEVEEWGADLVINYQGPGQTQVRIGLAPNGEYFDGVDYDNTRYSVNASTRPSGDLALEMGVSWGETIDFANSQQAEFVRLTPEIDFNIGRHLQGEVEYVREIFDVDGGELFTAELTQLRLLYHLSLRSFLRTIVQYRDVERNLDLYTFPVEPQSEGLFTQLLFSYKINPQTVLLTGYSDTSFGSSQFDLTRADRTFFLKVGYALLF